jgi:phospholipid-translocating ATPase
MDRATNNRMFPVLKAGQMKDLKSQDIEIGDIVSVKNHQEIPCDMILISSVNSSGKCHVTTANLDGETNLKVRECLEVTKSMQSPESLKQLKGVIECEKPNSDLYEFIGTMKLEQTGPDGHPLGPQNLLVRGSRLQNTSFVYGVAVYTGPETKLALNSRLTSNKFSSVEKTANRYLISYLIILLIFSVTFTGIRFAVMSNATMGQAWYFKELVVKTIDVSDPLLIMRLI